MTKLKACLLEFRGSQELEYYPNLKKTIDELKKQFREEFLPLDSGLNTEFERIQKHKNYIFSSGIDLIHEFFNFERKTNNDFLSKSIQYFNKNPSVKKIFTRIADKGLLF